MKKPLLVLAGLLLLTTVRATDPAHEATSPSHQEAGCPAHRAAEAGFDPFDGFHKIMAPVWHQAWPNRNYDALLAAGPEFKKAFADIIKLEPAFKSESRREAFAKALSEFGLIVNSYAAAAEKGDKETVYQLMPRLHDAFEMTAAALLPVSYPEAEALSITLNLILETYLPKNNREGIIASTDTLIAKLDIMSDSTAIPEELRDKKDAILSDVAAMSELVRQMKECCDKNDMAGYKEHAGELESKLKEFFKSYI